MITEGRARVVGDDVDTDAIIPARYLGASLPEQLGPHCLEGLVPPLEPALAPGDIIVAGRNFGCGSSREHAVIALSGAGVQAVIARSFSRIFFRNAVNTGLVVIECPEWDGIMDGQRLVLDTGRGALAVDGTREFEAATLPPFIQDLIAGGGLVPFVRRKLASGGDGG